jgi:predicted enzyme related to lactoylglutathione lyase
MLIVTTEERTMSLFQGINVVSICVTDLDRAREFYGTVLALGDPLFDLPESGWIEFATGAPAGNLAVTPAPDGWAPAAGTTIVLNTPDCAATCAELRRRGVRCEDPVVFPGYVTYCSFYDPFGNRLQMCSPAPDADG